MRRAQSICGEPRAPETAFVGDSGQKRGLDSKSGELGHVDTVSLEGLDNTFEPCRQNSTPPWSNPSLRRDWEHVAHEIVIDLGPGALSNPPAMCAGMLQSVPELGTNLGTHSLRRKLTDGQVLENSGGQGRD